MIKIMKESRFTVPGDSKTPLSGLVCHSTALLDPALIYLSSFPSGVGKVWSSALHRFSVSFCMPSSLYPPPGERFFCRNSTCHSGTFSSFMLDTSSGAIPSLPGRCLAALRTFMSVFSFPTALRVFLVYIYIY